MRGLFRLTSVETGVYYSQAELTRNSPCLFTVIAALMMIVIIAYKATVPATSRLSTCVKCMQATMAAGYEHHDAHTHVRSPGSIPF